jgi:tetratricopeptide (TPR) repeat protein
MTSRLSDRHMLRRLHRIVGIRVAGCCALLVSSVLHANGQNDLCSDKTKSLEARISCVETAQPDNPTRGRTIKLLKNPCSAEASWALFEGESKPGLFKTASDNVATELASRCDQFENLRTGDEFLRAGRYDDAKTYYSKIPGIGAQNMIPQYYEHARRGSIAATRLINTLVMPPKDVVRLERTGKFDDAYILVTQARPTADGHRKMLGNFLAAEKTSNLYQDRGNYDLAQSAYSSLLPSLDPVRDVVLADWLRAEIFRLQPLTEAQANREASSLLKVGDIQSARGDFAGAAVTYAKAIEKKSALEPGIYDEINERAVKARIQAAREPSFRGVTLVFLDSLKSTFVRLISYVPYVAVYCCALGLILGVIWLTIQILPADRDKSVSLEDLTGPASADANLLVTNQLEREMALPEPDQRLSVEASGIESESSMGHLSFGLPLNALGSAFSANASIPFGPLLINPLQILQLLQPFFKKRHRYELEGSITVNGTETLCAMTLKRYPKAFVPAQTYWEAFASGDDAKAQVIRAIAMQIVVSLDDRALTFSSNWRSLDGLTEGLHTLHKHGGDASSRLENIKSARVCFESAVLADPNNWMARTNLGLVLSKLGQNGLAAEQYREALRRNSLPSVYRPVVEYSLAAALQKSDDDGVAAEVLELLIGVVAKPGVDPLVRRLAESGILATWANRLVRRKRWLDQSDSSPDQVRAFDADVSEHCISSEEMLTRLEREKPVNGTDEDNVVVAVALNAAGQLKILARRPADARERLRRAITLLPSFVEPSLNLAELYLDRKRSLDVNWATRAQALLLNVQALDPSNARAATLLGSLYATPLFGRPDDAIAQLKSALPDPIAARRLGTLFLALDRAADAIQPLTTAAEQEPEYGISNYLLALAAVKLLADSQGCRLLARSERWLNKAIKDGKSKGTRYARLLERVHQRKKQCSST